MNATISKILWHGLLGNFMRFGERKRFWIEFETTEIRGEIDHAAWMNKWDQFLEKFLNAALNGPIVFSAFAI
jgi:hypothetical protein